MSLLCPVVILEALLKSCSHRSGSRIYENKLSTLSISSAYNGREPIALSKTLELILETIAGNNSEVVECARGLLNSAQT
ncbi:hypothetical protein ILYODFUR_031181 [Ilyodon furcidens]|uniref:Uncharacterized protein n=1 Tax=Ilyodon furcidens TaxID=33524 RepID=A0ABV0UBP5_9TELE